MKEDFNYVQKFWYKGYMITQNCGLDNTFIGKYNGYTIFKLEGDIFGENDQYIEVLHVTLKGNQALTIKELKEKIENYKKINDIIE